MLIRACNPFGSSGYDSSIQSDVVPNPGLLVRAIQTFKKRFKAPAASRKIVRCCTKTVKGSKAKFDPRYNSWCNAIPRGETGGTQSGTQSGAVAGARGTAPFCELEPDGSSESDGEDLAIDSDDDDGDGDSDGDDGVVDDDDDDDDDDDANLDLDDLDDADDGPAAMPRRRGSAAVAAAAIKLLDDLSPPRETRRGRPVAWS